MVESWQVWAFLSAIFAAATAILAKVGVQDVNSNYATFIRTIVVIIFLTIIVVARGELQPLSSLTPRTKLFLVLSGLATGLSWLCYFRALKLGPVSKVAPIDKLSLVFVTVLGVVVLGERLSGRNWLGAVLMGLGVILLALKK